MEKLNERQQGLLKIIIEYYIKHAIPVGSKQINNDFGLSSATIRNEMAELEKLGYLIQPHVSAGRIPSENAYRFYVNNYINESKIGIEDETLLADLAGNLNDRDSLKNIAKKLAEILNLAIIVAFDKNDVYYTGMSGLFSQPEFKRDFVYIADFSNLFDNMDDKISSIFDDIDDKISVYFGSDNPFSDFCGAILLKITNNQMIVVLGPLRMDYLRIMNLLEYIKNKNK